MIKLCRVDSRLLHGQIAFSWCSALKANCILLASDDAAGNPVRMQALRLAKPAGMKLVIKSIDDSIAAINSGATDKYDLMIVTDSVLNVCRLASSCDRITEVNLGGTGKEPKNEVKSLGPAVHLTQQDCDALKKILESGIEVDVRQVAGDRKQMVTASELN